MVSPVLDCKILEVIQQEVSSFISIFRIASFLFNVPHGISKNLLAKKRYGWLTSLLATIFPVVLSIRYCEIVPSRMYLITVSTVAKGAWNHSRG